MVGTTIAHYRIIEQLGAGGMGEVYRAEDTRLKRHVALKILPPELVPDPIRLQRFRREAETLATLDHPSIVTVYSVEESDGTPFLTMGLVEGKTLDQEIPEGGLSLETFFAVAIPVADALAAAHDKGIVHRDLKPTNIMVDRDGRPRILDFGLAKLRRREGAAEASQVSTRLTRSGTALGTLPYMSPEQVQGRTADRRSDVFSLGIVLYEMATGMRPFRGATPADLASSILRDTPPLVTGVRSELSRQLGRIIHQCLEKQPRRRYQDVLDVRNQLEALQKERDAEAILERDTSERQSLDRKFPSDGQSRSLAVPVRTAIATGLLIGVMVVAAAWWFFQRTGSETVSAVEPTVAGDAATFQSLAVLPFANLMDDPEQEYFVQGMHEALITNLARLEDLRVISRTSAMRYRETTKSIPEIARELDVDAVVEGSVLRAGDRVRINAQLIDGETDEHLWADSYDRDLRNVLALLDDVARAVGGEIKLAVSTDDEGPLGPAPPVDPDVYELVLRARHSFNQGTRKSLRRTVALARQALEIDPDYAPARVQVSSAYLLLGAWGHTPREEAIPASKTAALEALALDDTLAEAHSALGWIEMYFEWDWRKAEKSFRRALELNPNDPYARHGLGDYLCAMGRVDEGLAQVELGFKYDPFSPLTLGPYIGHLVWARRYEEALAQYRKGLELFPSRRIGRSFVRVALWELGLHREVVEEWKEDLPTDEALELEAVFEGEGSQRALRWMAERRVSRAESADADAFDAAGWLAWAGEVNRAFPWLERAYEQRIPTLFQVRTHPRFDSLRADPRYQDLLRRMNLPL